MRSLLLLCAWLACVLSSHSHALASEESATATKAEGDTDVASGSCANEDVASNTTASVIAEDDDDEDDGKDGDHDEDDRGWWKEANLTLQTVYDDILDCDKFLGERPIHNESVWAMLRGAFMGINGPGEAAVPIDFDDGFLVPFEVKQIPKAGRAVFATGAIANGTKVWEGAYEACFSTGRKFRFFLSVLPDYVACDVMDWAYTLDMEVCVDLDEGSLINSATFGDFEWLSMGDDVMAQNIATWFDNATESYYQVAIRDIEAGDQLVTKYDAFEDLQGWIDLGLGDWGETTTALSTGKYDTPEAAAAAKEKK
uniref:SET domain-containing protein n=1 Tax=Craspedostauros australis TaxID=1486917 RepID=A0A7R9ZK76_9STRA|mmetsp:Transcript_17062/g.47254  ORF Transcript_17062/g.47254 Transcript_17062/m.47254 type:complete len:312 (+) Transcript_17062:154-1089(+)|eukprot:CAMPEP_0198128840 /NCGR_PEP_ID=MMETSP1442-20131203/50310_1 /TAXON_ID= /ORGANISM="Craspedostauros australis, Strain CCMP3328" /LENGTH=311 /DNA_ID=CAMNT_0043789087 /DNA_START=114 /DNA_END=1049 /DNA_ORIENTATION=-